MSWMCAARARMGATVAAMDPVGVVRCADMASLQSHWVLGGCRQDTVIQEREN